MELESPIPVFASSEVIEEPPLNSSGMALAISLKLFIIDHLANFESGFGFTLPNP